MQETHRSAKLRLKEYFLCMSGGVLYALGLNLFIFPMGLYIGNVTGIAQVFQAVLNALFGLNMNQTGLFLFFVNVPLLLLTYRVLQKGFFYKTVATLLAQTLAMALIPVGTSPLLDDRLTLCLLGGILSGFGAGFSLRYGGSGGGLDIMGVYFSLKYKGVSVGKVSLWVSAFVLVYVALNFPKDIFIYSLIFTVIYSFVLDLAHYQNVKVCALIITEDPKVAAHVNARTSRGVTAWPARGVYTNEAKHVVFAVVDKFEFLNFKNELTQMDPQVFIVDWERISVTGRFDKHLFL